MNTELMQQLQASMPPLFAATELDRLTGNSLRWTTLQNRRANKNIPESEKPPKSCFRQDGARKILIVRDELLTWWLGTLDDCE